MSHCRTSDLKYFNIELDELKWNSTEQDSTGRNLELKQKNYVV